MAAGVPGPAQFPVLCDASRRTALLLFGALQRISASDSAQSGRTVLMCTHPLCPGGLGGPSLLGGVWGFGGSVTDRPLLRGMWTGWWTLTISGTARYFPLSVLPAP